MLHRDPVRWEYDDDEPTGVNLVGQMLAISMKLELLVSAEHLSWPDLRNFDDRYQLRYCELSDEELKLGV